MSLRVVHLLSGDLWGGSEAACYHALRALHRAGDVAVTALLLNDGEPARRLAESGVPVRIESESDCGFHDLLRRVRAALDGADLVHAHGYKEDCLAALSGRPWLATVHGRPEPLAGLAALRFRVYDRIDRLALRWGARRAIAVSREMQRWLERRLGPERVVHAWNGVADPQATVAPKPWSERPLRVGVLARLFPVKNVELAIEAVARRPELQLEVLGEGPERARLERLARERCAAGRIRFRGFDPEPAARVARWRLLLMPSHHEANPLAVMEALALGTPVLAGPLPGVAEILDGRGGWLLDHRDPAGWSRALAAYAHGSEGARASCEARGRYLEAFSDRAAAQRLRDVYEEALSNSPA